MMRNKAGKPPGELAVAVDDAARTSVSVITFNDKTFTHETLESPAGLTELLSPDTTNWVHVSGFRDTGTFQQIGEIFGINPLVIEDTLNTEHLPKYEEIEDQLFVIVKAISRGENRSEYTVNHLGFVLRQNLVISFAQYPTNAFDGFIDRIRRAVGKIRQRREDYVFYRLIDIITDQYFLVFEDLEDELFEMEEKLGTDDLERPAEQITAVKKNIFYLKKFLQPTTEAISNVLKSETGLVKKQNRVFFTDVIDHLRHLLQNLDGYRETAISLMELHVSNNANRMNEVMKTLTLIATIFIPLTFLAGVYGMNFKYMPELDYKWAYPTVLLIMLVAGLGMYIYMKRRKWF